MKDIILIVHDIRSTHNVGSIMRTAECMGVRKIVFSGYTPYPRAKKDTRLPHISNKLHKQIAKTALGAEDIVAWELTNDVKHTLTSLKQADYTIVGLEQHKKSISLPRFESPSKVALIIGREVEGIEPWLLALCDDIIEIPQYGKKESLNVVQACAIALYALQES